MASGDELFDVVDANDAVIRTERRAVVHRDGLLHRAVHILLRNRAGEVFLQRRSPFKDMNPDCWDSSCSGHVDSGEGYDSAAFRELGEELGIFLKEGEIAPLLKISACRQTGNEFVWVYAGTHEGPFVLHPEEISDGRFFTPAEIDRGIAETPREFSPAFRYVWQQAKVSLGLPPSS
jgi:isopentenyl-diphosphate delta-isomerase